MIILSSLASQTTFNIQMPCMFFRSTWPPYYTSLVKLSGTVLQTHEPKRNDEESFKKLMYLDPQEDEFRNLISTSLSNDDSISRF